MLYSPDSHTVVKRPLNNRNRNNKETEVRGFEPHPKTLPEHLHTALRAVATVHIGKGAG
jgi:hypothetical protein